MWPTLEADQKKFVQGYNATFKHKENLNELKVPAGITLRHKIRRVNNDDKNKKLEESSEKKKKMK